MNKNRTRLRAQLISFVALGNGCCESRKIRVYQPLVCPLPSVSHTSSSGRPSQVLSNKACLEAYGSGNIISSMICASDAGRDSCQGDSGGPLVFRDAGNNYDQVSVVLCSSVAVVQVSVVLCPTVAVVPNIS